MKFLAVDLGASSGRTIVADLNAGKITLTETHRFENQMLDLNGEKHWDFERLMGEVQAGIGKSGAVDGIGVDTWGVDYGLLDAKGKLLDRPFAYRDSRHEKAMPVVYGKLPKAKLYGLAGIQEMSLNSIFQLVAEQMLRPEVLKRAKRLLFIPELINYRLTGKKVSEYTICSTSGLLDARTRQWSDDALTALGLPRGIFGEVRFPGERVGDYQGTPVFLPATHDTGSAVAAVPAIEGGDWAYLSSGTWSLIGAELDQPVLNEAAAAANFTNEGGVDGKIRFLKNVNGLWLIQECRRIWADEGRKLSFAEIAAAAEQAPHFTSVINPNDPRFLAPANMPAAIAAACRETGQAEPKSIGETARCCYQSLAEAYRRELAGLAQVTGKRFQRLHIVGGGSQAELLNQLTADRCQVPVIAGPVEATALGNVGVQARAHGLFKDLRALREAIAAAFPVKVYQPRG